jgi:hypothetical protein
MMQGEDAAEDGKNLELKEAVAEHEREARVSEAALCLQGHNTFDWLSLGLLPLTSYLLPLTSYLSLGPHLS